MRCVAAIGRREDDFAAFAHRGGAQQRRCPSPTVIRRGHGP
jgi:hypothetical protein